MSKVLQNAPLGAFCNTFDLHYAIIGVKNKFWSFECGRLRQVLLYLWEIIPSLCRLDHICVYSR